MNQIKTNKIAKKIIKSFYNSIGKQTLQYFESFLNNLISKRWNIKSYKNHLNEEYIQGITAINGWDCFEYCSPQDSKEFIKNIQQNFYQKFKNSLFNEKSKEESLKIISSCIINQDDNNQIWKQYKKYENDSCSEDLALLFITIQFYINKCIIYTGQSDLQRKKPEYFYKRDIDFEDINKPDVIQKIENTIKEAIKSINFIEI